MHDACTVVSGWLVNEAIIHEGLIMIKTLWSRTFNHIYKSEETRDSKKWQEKVFSNKSTCLVLYIKLDDKG